MIALNEKSSSMVERVLRDFKEHIDFEEAGNTGYYTYEMNHDKSAVGALPKH